MFNAWGNLRLNRVLNGILCVLFLLRSELPFVQIRKRIGQTTAKNSEIWVILRGVFFYCSAKRNHFILLRLKRNEMFPCG